MAYVEGNATDGSGTLSVDGSTDEFLVSGQCDILIKGLITGYIQLKAKFPNWDFWVDLPDSQFSVDVFKTIYMAEDQVRMKLVGSGNNADVVVRLGRRG